MIGKAILYFVIAAVLLAAFLLFAKKKKTKRFGTIMLSVAVFLEIFVFNFHSFHLMFGSYEKTELDFSGASVSGGSFDDLGRLVSGGDGGLVIIEFKDIGQKTGTLYIDCIMPSGQTDPENNNISGRTDYINVSIDAKDATYSQSYRNNIAYGQIINGDEKTRTIILNLSGEVKDLRITLRTENDSYFIVNSMTLNSMAPIDMSVLRLLITVLVPFGIYALLNFESLKDKYENRKKIFSGAAVVITAVLVTASIALTFAYNFNSFGAVFSQFKNTSGNQISQELVDAFETGQVSLLDKPSDELLALDNPYDWSERNSSGVSYKWDHLLFEGKYYSYYGIAPVLILFLPYHLLTGYYFPTAEAVLVFGAVGIIFLSLLYMELIKRFFPKISVGMGLCGLIVLQMSSGIWYCFSSPLFYEIAQSSGFMFTCMGFYFLIRSGVVGNGRISRLSLAASAFCLSMAVLCRPTLALYCIAALIFIAFGFVKNRKIAIEEGKSVRKESVKYLACALVCFVVIGSVQMIYNYLRFGSFFDFGIQYSLTINDFTRSQYHTDFAMIGYFNYLFAFPQINTEFPFVFSNFSDLDVNGYYYVANKNAVGLFWRAIVMFGYFGAYSAYRKSDRDKRLPALLIISSVCVLAPLIIIFSIWESGYGIRYCVDFAWQMITGALCILFYHYVSMENRAEKRDMRNLMSVFFICAAAVSIIVNFAMVYDYLPKTGMLESGYLSFERIFEFWK